jgi:NAD(P)-dependent dehydrogenase (short-subunit alcohol dehydrogenase family)
VDEPSPFAALAYKAGMTQRSILITGCSSGIGYAVAHGLRDMGWRVFASCRQEVDCARMRAEGFDSPRIDYSDPQTIESGLSEVLDLTGGTLDALFNNGAYAVPGAAEDLPVQALREIFEVNVFGWHDLTCRVIPVMRAQGHGRIINHGSVLGLVTMPWRMAYNTTKFAIEGMTDTLRIEMRDTPIHVITLNTGPVTSKIRVNSIPHFEKWVNWQRSPRRAQYEAKLIKRLYEDRGPDAFELPPQAVTRKLRHALEHPNPRPRYLITTPTYLMDAARRALPTRALDWLLAKG